MTVQDKEQKSSYRLYLLAECALNENKPTQYVAHHSVPKLIDLKIHFQHFKSVTFMSSASGAATLWQLMLLKVRSLHAKIRKINFSPQRWNCYAQGLSYDSETTE